MFEHEKSVRPRETGRRGGGAKAARVCIGSPAPVCLAFRSLLFLHAVDFRQVASFSARRPPRPFGNLRAAARNSYTLIRTLAPAWKLEAVAEADCMVSFYFCTLPSSQSDLSCTSRLVERFWRLNLGIAQRQSMFSCSENVKFLFKCRFAEASHGGRFRSISISFQKLAGAPNDAESWSWASYQ